MRRLDATFVEFAPFCLPAPLPDGPECRIPDCGRGIYSVAGDDPDFEGLCKRHRDQTIHSTQSRAQAARGGAA